MDFAYRTRDQHQAGFARKHLDSKHLGISQPALARVRSPIADRDTSASPQTSTWTAANVRLGTNDQRTAGWARLR